VNIQGVDIRPDPARSLSFHPPSQALYQRDCFHDIHFPFSKHVSLLFQWDDPILGPLFLSKLSDLTSLIIDSAFFKVIITGKHNIGLSTFSKLKITYEQIWLDGSIWRWIAILIGPR